MKIVEHENIISIGNIKKIERTSGFMSVK